MFKQKGPSKKKWNWQIYERKHGSYLSSEDFGYDIASEYES